MPIETILKLLKNSGFNVLGTDGVFIHLEDPSCILRGFETFIEYAWLAIMSITGLLLFGWAISMIRGAKYDSIFINLRNLVLIFGILSAVKPIVNVVWGDDVFARGCRTISVEISEIQKTVAANNLRFTEAGENLDIYDTGLPNERPYSEMPVMGAGSPEKIPVTISDGGDYSTGAFGRAASATAAGNDVIYTNQDGLRYNRSGGTRAWRNNNPGNIINSEFARKHGAIGTAGGFAVFPDENTGAAAITALLQTDKYNRLTVGGVINKYAPPSQNNTAGYQKKVEQRTGIPLSTPMTQLNNEQLQRIVNVIRQVEGWKVGSEARI